MVPTTTENRSVWPAIGAAIWSFLFALVSVYWALGGTIGGSTLARSIEEQARDPTTTLVIVLWVTALLKALAGVIALGLIQPWGRRVPHWLILLGAWGAGILLTLYGLAGIVEKVLWEIDVRDVPTSFGEDRVRWYLYFWDPLWLLGGVLFLIAAWIFQRRGRNVDTGDPS